MDPERASSGFAEFICGIIFRISRCTNGHPDLVANVKRAYSSSRESCRLPGGPGSLRKCTILGAQNRVAIRALLSEPPLAVERQAYEPAFVEIIAPSRLGCGYLLQNGDP